MNLSTQKYFNDILKSIEEGTYNDSKLILKCMELTDDDAAQLCAAIRGAAEAGKCNITYLDLSGNELTSFNGKGLTQLELLYLDNNQLTSFNGKGLTQLKKLFLAKNHLTTIKNVEWLTQLELLCLDNNHFTTLNVARLARLKRLYLDNNQLTTINIEGWTKFIMLYLDKNPLTTLTRAKLFSLVPAHALVGVVAPTSAEQTQVNNEFNQKVTWAMQQFFNGNESVDVRLALKSELEKDKCLLLTPKDSVYVMREASTRVAKQMAKKRETFDLHVKDDSFLMLLPEHMRKSITLYMCSHSPNAPDLPAEEDAIPLIGGSIKP